MIFIIHNRLITQTIFLHNNVFTSMAILLCHVHVVLMSNKVLLILSNQTCPWKFEFLTKNLCTSNLLRIMFFSHYIFDWF